MRFVWVVLSAIILSLFAVQPTHAQTNPAWCDGNFKWQYEWNFAINNGGFARYQNFSQSPSGQWLSGQGWSFGGSGAANTLISVRLTGQNFVAQHLEATISDNTNARSSVNDQIFIGNASAGTSPPYSSVQLMWSNNADFNQSNRIVSATNLANTTASNAIYIYSSSSPIALNLISSIRIRGTGAPPTSINGGTLTECNYAPALTRPISTADRVMSVVGQSILQTTTTTTEAMNKNAVIFGSDNTGVRVSAVISGTVTAVRDFDRSACTQLLWGSLTTCKIPLVTRTVLGQTYPPTQTVTSTDLFLWDIGFGNDPLYTVDITTNTGTVITQLVKNAHSYITVGQSVSAGCWVGETVNTISYAGLNSILSVFNDVAGLLFELVSSDRSINSVTAVWVQQAGQYVNAWEWYTSDPPASAAPCNRPASPEGCLGDFDLRNPAQWDFGNDVTWENPGVLLPPGAFISANPPFNLTQAQLPEMIVRGRIPAWGSPSSVELQLGVTRTAFNLASSAALENSVRITASAHAPDLAGLYSITVRNTGSTALHIYFVCVRLTSVPGGGTPPPEPGGGGPTEPPPAGVGETVNEAGCIRVPFPAGESVASWTSWLWARLNRFFQCDLMLILRQVRAEIASFARTVSLSIRWNMALAQRALDWIGTSLIPYFAGYLANIQPATVEIEGCNNFWCALASIIGNIITGVIAPILDLINTILNFATDILGNLINAFIDLIFSFINTALTLFNIARLAFLALLNAWLNSTPTMPPGFATCPTIPDSSNPLCLLFWVLENTVFTQSGALIIPVMTGWFSIHLVLYFISEIKRTVIQLGQAT